MTLPACVGQVLAPTLPQADIMIMDKLPAHKTSGIRDITKAKGAELRFLPPYSPDFNPIEMAFSRLKSIMRSKAEPSIEALWNTVGEVIDLFKADECANYFQAAGYEPT